jgi:hypothetical protein
MLQHLCRNTRKLLLFCRFTHSTLCACLQHIVPFFVVCNNNIYFIQVVINDCSRSNPCPCYEIFAALYQHNFNVAPTVNCVNCANGVYSLIHIILIIFIWSGNHKFYIKFLRQLGLQSVV